MLTGVQDGQDDDNLPVTQPVDPRPSDKETPIDVSNGTTTGIGTTKSTTQDHTGSLQLNYQNTITFSQIDLGQTQKLSSGSEQTTQSQSQPFHETPKAQRNGYMDIPSSIGRPEFFERFQSPEKAATTSPAINEVITKLPTNSAFSSLSQIFQTSSPIRNLPSAAPTPALRRTGHPLRIHSSPTREPPLRFHSSPTREPESMGDPPITKRAKREKTQPATTYVTIDDSQKARDKRYRFARSTSPTDWASSPRVGLKKSSTFIDSWGNDDDSLGRKIRMQKAQREKDEEVKQMFANLKAPPKPAEAVGKRPGRGTTVAQKKVELEEITRLRSSQIQVARSEDSNYDDFEETADVEDGTANTGVDDTDICPQSPGADWQGEPTQIIPNPPRTARRVSVDIMEWEGPHGDTGYSRPPRKHTQTSTILDSQPSLQITREDLQRQDTGEEDVVGSPVIPSSPPSLPMEDNPEVVRDSSPPHETPCKYRRLNRASEPRTPARPRRSILTPETTSPLTPLPPTDPIRGSAKRKRPIAPSQESKEGRQDKKKKTEVDDAEVVPCSLEEETTKRKTEIEVVITKSGASTVPDTSDFKELERTTASPGPSRLSATKAVPRRASHNALRRISHTDMPKLRIPRKTRSGTSLRESVLGSAIDPSETTESVEMRNSFNSAPNRVFALFKDSKMHYFPATVVPSPFMSDRSTLNVQFDDETVVAVDKIHIRSLDLRAGDQVRVDMPTLKQRIWHIQELKSVIPDSSKQDKAFTLTDVRGHNVAVVASKVKTDKEELKVEVPITKLYIPKSMWHQFFGRNFLHSTTVSAISVDSPWSPSRSRMAEGAMQMSMKSSMLVPRQSVGTGIFTGMLFAISIGDKDSEKKSIIKTITSNGGQILETGFEELFALPSASDSSSEMLPLPHTSDLGFTCVLSDKHTRRAKFLQALALGIPCLHIRWVKDCFKEVRSP